MLLVGRSLVRRARSFCTISSAVEFDLDTVRRELIAEHVRNSARAMSAEYGSPAAAPQYDSPAAPWHWLDAEMSSNVAGETGAVCIYDGAAAALRLRGGTCEQTLQFVEEHRAAEQSHLQLFQELLPPHKHTRLLPVWRVAGFTLGFLPALLSDRALFLTVEAVETFVEIHYHEQITPLKASGRCPQLVELLEHCCADEVHHKEDAAARSGHPGTATTKIESAWMTLVRVGSAVAAEVARRV